MRSLHPSSFIPHPFIMRIVLNGWFLDQPDTGSGQYTLQLLKHLPQVAPQHEYALVVPHKNSFEIADITAGIDLQILTSNNHFSQVALRTVNHAARGAGLRA